MALNHRVTSVTSVTNVPVSLLLRCVRDEVKRTPCWLLVSRWTQTLTSWWNPVRLSMICFPSLSSWILNSDWFHSVSRRICQKRFLASVFTSWLCKVSPAGPDHKSLLGPALYCADRFFFKSIANIKPLVKTRLVTAKPQMSTTWRCWSQATKRVRILPLGIRIFPLNPSSSCRYISLLAEVVRSYRHRGVC